MCDMDSFYEALIRDRAKGPLLDRRSMSRVKYETIIARVLDAKTKPEKSKEREDHIFASRYDVLLENGEKKLIEPLKQGDTSVKYYVHDDQLFDVLNDFHVMLGHGGRDKMNITIRKKYKNISLRTIQIFLKNCDVCARKLGAHKKVKLVAEEVFKEVAEVKVRGHVEVLDFRHQPDGDFNYVMAYQDLETNFVALRAMKSKTADEVADRLVDIFTMIGAPFILESDEGRIFTHEIIVALQVLWPELKLLNGKVSAVRYDMNKIVDMIEAWMRDCQSRKWSHGLRFVQFLKNGYVHPDHKAPFDLLFSSRVKLGLTSDVVPYSQLSCLTTEEDLIKAIKSSLTDVSQADETDDDVGLLDFEEDEQD